MIKKYRTEAMSEIWSLENQYKLWWDVERAAVKGWVEVGEVPADALKEIDQKVDWSVERIKEHEEVLRHDMLAFLETLEESLGELSAHVHRGLTSSDIQDTEKSLRILQSLDLVTGEVDGMLEVLRKLAKEHKWTVMIGRTHGVHAEPVTFGLKCLIWYEEWKRQKERLERAREQIRVGKLSGAVGTYAHLDPRVEEIACEELGIEPAPVSNQILQRDRHAEVAGALANLAGTLEKMAVEVRNLQRTELLEVQESFTSGQKGSSAMPHKKNPIVAERISGQARVVRGYADSIYETQALWHERDLSNSSTERIVFPDLFQLVHYMMKKAVDLFDNLQVNEDNMRKNIDKTHGVIFSQKLMLELSKTGLDRSKAYETIQSLAMESWETGTSFARVLENDEVTSVLDADTLDRCFQVETLLPHVDDVYQRVFPD